MRVFVAGASGAIGRPLVPKLIAAGHEVTGMTRSEARAEDVRAAGARTRRSWTCSTPTRSRQRCRAAAPEVVIHQLTALPERMNFRKEDISTREPTACGPRAPGT